MQGIIKPSSTAIAETTIPSWIADKNPNFVAFVQYYYAWLAKDNNPLDLLQNIIEYRNAQTTTPQYFQIIAQEIMNFIPQGSTVNAALIESRIRDFYLSKGTLPSYEFMINLLYGNTVSLVWNSDKVFRASSNGSSRSATIGIYSKTPWTSDVNGSTLVQTYPTFAEVKINSCTNIIVNGLNLNVLDIDPTSIVGTFVQAGAVQVLSNKINRSFTPVTVYYNSVALDTQLLIVSTQVETPRTYPGLIVKQVGSTFQATISSLQNRVIVNSSVQLSFVLTNITGTYSTGQIYFLTASEVATSYASDNYFYGSVSPCVTNITFTNNGSLYNTSDPINYSGGSGTPFSVSVSDIGGGSVENIAIINAGSGYSIGDSLQSTTLKSYGSGFQAQVTSIDGIGATISQEMQLDNFQIVNGGSQYSVGDIITFSDGVYNSAIGPAKLQVTTINSSGTVLNNIKVLQGGYGYTYANLALFDNVSNALVTPFSATGNLLNGSLTSVTNITAPTLTHSNVSLLVNGVGGSVTVTITAGVVTGVSIINGGNNYVNPQLLIQSTVTPILAATFLFTIVNGVITGISILNGGAGYAFSGASSGSEIVSITELNGWGASTSCIVNSTTGPITAATILTNGSYTTKLPTVYNTPYTSNSVTGNGLVLNTKYKFNKISIINAGMYYRSPTVDTSYGIGSGAVILPIVNDGTITSITINSGGLNYQTANVSVVGSGRNFNCIANINSTTGAITGFVILNAGYGYVVGDKIVITGTPKTSTTITPATFGTGGSNQLNSGNLTNGVVTSMKVISGGSNYAYDTTVSYVLDPTDYTVGYSPASMTPVITNGSISSVIILSGGYGYPNLSASVLTNDLLQEDGSSHLLLEDGSTLIARDTLYNQVVISAGTPALLTFNKPNIGGVLAANITSAGKGYYDPATISPLAISMSSITGSGALLLPVLSNGVITSVNVISGGSGYVTSVYSNNQTTYVSGDTIKVTGGVGSGALLIPNIVNGIVVSVSIISGGSSYYYGTTAYVIGDGSGATLSCSVGTRGTISGVRIISSGVNYTGTFLTVVDAYGSGAVITPNINPVTGGIDSVTIVNGGYGYRSPTVNISSTTGSGANINLTINSDISSLQVTSAGKGYTYASVFIVGDGTGATATVLIENNGSLYNPQIISAGTGYTTIPSPVVTDSSGYGAITGIKITNPGSSYTLPPILSMTQKFYQGIQTTTPATFSCWGKNIGSIRNIAFNSYGYGWEQIPNILTPIHAVMQTNASFTLGETVTISNHPYVVPDTSFKLLTEDGLFNICETIVYNTLGNEDDSTILTEDGSYLDVEALYQLDQEFYSYEATTSTIQTSSWDGAGSVWDSVLSAWDTSVIISTSQLPYQDYGPTGIITQLDYARNIIEISNATNAFRFITESGNEIITENVFHVALENSNPIDIGATVVGSTSKALSTIKWLNRAEGYAVVDGVGITTNTMTNKVGVLNDPHSLLHDGQRIQDYAYVVRTATPLLQYKQILTDIVHPAGYEMYGDVVDYSFAQLPAVKSAPSKTGSTGSSFSIVLQIKNIFANYYLSFNIGLQYYDAIKWSFFTTAGQPFINYTFQNFDIANANYLGSITKPVEIEPYVVKQYTNTGAAVVANSNIITGMGSTTGIQIGYRVVAYDATTGRSVFYSYDGSGKSIAPSSDYAIVIAVNPTSIMLDTQVKTASTNLTVVSQFTPDSLVPPVMALTGNSVATSVKSIGTTSTSSINTLTNTVLKTSVGTVTKV